MIPCKDCLILPICRHKKFREMVDECSTLHSHFWTHGDSPAMINQKVEIIRRRISEVECLINPVQWKSAPRDYASWIVDKDGKEKYVL